MKQILTLVLLFSFGFSNATIRRVTNTVGTTPVPGLVYVNTLTNGSSDAVLQAIADAQNGDTIYVEPSPLSYGNVQLSKSLTIIGNGYEIGQNQTAISPLPFNVNESKFGNFSFLAGSENAQIIGLRLTSNGAVNANNVKITRCMFDTDLNFGATNILVDQCYFGHGASIFGSGTNNIVKNCIIGEFIQTIDNVLFDQCYIHLLSPSFVTNCTFTNCIINTIPANCPLTNTFSHSLKIGTGTTFPVAGINNNIEGVDMATLFEVENPYITIPIRERRFILKSTSPAKSVGTSGQDIGPFGGATPYRLSGQAPVPIVTNFFLSTTGSSASGLAGSITIQSNN